MRAFFCIFTCIALSANICRAQSTQSREIYNKDFNWTVVVPKGFENVSSEQWAKFQNKGASAVEATYGQQVVNKAKIIFVFRSGEMNYFESNYQPLDTTVDGSYIESCKKVDGILYETFVTQMPGVKIDTLHGAEKIDGLEFQTFNMKVNYGNKVVLNAQMFTRLFGNKEFSVNVMYVDKEKGQQMLDAWRHSKFSR